MIIVAAVLIGLAWWLGKPFRETQMLEPSGRLDKDHFAVTVVEGILNFLSGIIQHGIGPRPLLPLLGTYGLFILFLNLAGLVPGFNPPTDQFNITFAFAIVVFLLTHTLGIRQHGAGYIKQFIGPMPLMAPLMFPVELISHLVRPMSLSIRLLGNMTGLFILFLNLAGLVPGFNPPTDQFNITFAFAIVVFLLTHTLGIRQHGAGYIKQFIGPMPLMAPLMFPVELISHLVRPMSLSIRLLGNMTGDHKVVLIFSSILALGLPVPFMGLGILISVLQAFVFVLLSAIYFEVAMSEAH